MQEDSGNSQCFQRVCFYSMFGQRERSKRSSRRHRFTAASL